MLSVEVQEGFPYRAELCVLSHEEYTVFLTEATGKPLQAEEIHGDNLDKTQKT